MPATLRRETSERAWSTASHSGRSVGVSRHVHAVQLAGLEQRVRHKQMMVGWLDVVGSLVNAAAVLAFLAAAAGVGAVFVSFRNAESTLPGLAVFLVCLTAAVGFVATRSLVINGKRALCRDIEETLAERSRLQYLR